MVIAQFTPPLRHNSRIQSFKRREFIPLDEGILWAIEEGAVRTFTLTEDGTVISLGFWGAQDVVGQPLTCIQPYHIECLADVQVRCVLPNECWHLNQVMLSHIHQMQELLRMRSGQIAERLRQLLEWLADKFGHETEQGRRIELRLTHQDIADTLGTTRVTITRLLRQFEQDKMISWFRQHYIQLH
ncbi:MAG: Crp/Fnr family transcriptional regulator [Leptolyngbyaceae cyanobacterium RU_5_1]|nr:Crp/Fnr family transcriptional regulator [Leptolyngbyaceae cyanobacterium RU_5_1]